ncbi:hypothetical protein A1351_20245 [Methylosinus sp. R-45379]|uniref:hypothetical protein n=1 Tax=Methylosinus sp. R-45379 TaxID=980563 RepID=UPI0007C9960B|nr:hypothetical protein [Methylosinus sp. R-45379]OAI22901.1 hypothetical protein A1351_20245 [Methylosinus sp. R-45379]
MTDLFGSSPSVATPQDPVATATRGGVVNVDGRKRIVHRCFVCNSDLAPFGRGSAFRVEEMVWACREHRGELG